MLKKWSLSRIQIDESMAEIPWEWVPGLVIIPADNASPQEPAPIVTDRPSRTQKLVGLLRRIRGRITRFATESSEVIVEGRVPIPLTAQA